MTDNPQIEPESLNPQTESESPNPQTQYDSPWKDILEQYFEDFILFFFPQEHQEIDWTRKPEFLDKELLSIVRDAKLGTRFADKLVKIYRHSGKEDWILVHVEVQSQEETDFPKRIYIYNSRIFNKYDKFVVSVAVLGDTALPAVMRYTKDTNIIFL
ncbi:MAG: hypothetical protein KME64_24350 [Scytonematopsis contorta HA4267-MV1]|jgi:hypothetical protein|nr:hypothetical protein [Scytonematopsis contorta HA4267-MV1]